jgi:hypothetical protein
MTTATPPTPTTLADLRASGHRYKAVKHELRDNLLRRLAEGGERFPASSGSTTPCCPSWSGPWLAGHDIVLLGERGQGKTRLIPLAAPPAGTSGPRGGRLRDQRPPVRAHLHVLPAAGWTSWATSCGGLAPPLRALRREAGHPRHQRRRPDRRHRPDQGGRGPHPRRPRDRPLRARAPHQPGHLQRQRAARPGRADPGGAAQRARGARHPGPRLPAAAAPRPAAGGQRQPRGLHQPGPHHHPAQGPLRGRGPHPLPAAPGRRADPDAPGGRARLGRGRPSGGRSSPATCSR